MSRLLLAALAIALPASASAQVWVPGHIKSDGTYVPGRWLPTPQTPEMQAWIDRMESDAVVRAAPPQPYRYEPPKPYTVPEPPAPPCYFDCPE